VCSSAENKDRSGIKLSNQSGTVLTSISDRWGHSDRQFGFGAFYLDFLYRKENWMFYNTANGASASAMLYSILETAKLNNLCQYYYLKYILTELPKLCDEQGNIHPADLDYLMPWAEELPDECRKPCR